MGPIEKFISDAARDGVFLGDHTPEEMLAKLGVRDGYVNACTFVNHACKTSFSNLTTYEVLAGKVKASKLLHRGEDYLMDRTAAEPLANRVSLVLREAKWWDYKIAESEAA